jgi:hypothetical protein
MYRLSGHRGKRYEDLLPEANQYKLKTNLPFRWMLNAFTPVFVAAFFVNLSGAS